MLNLKAYTGRDLQNFLSMLNQVEDVGITDIRFVRERIYNYLNNDRQKTKGNMRFKFKGIEKRKKKEMCPSCGRGIMRPITNPDGLKIYGCGKCRYSQLRS